MRVSSTLAALALTAALAAAPAAAAVYNVSFSVGTASASGTITTDGTIGTLAAGNITDFSVLVADLTSSFNLLPGNSTIFLNGTGLTASLATLVFDHTAGISAFAILSGGNAICLDASAASPSCLGSAPSTTIRVALTAYTTSSPGQTQIAAAGTSVPAPASAAVLLVGLAGLAATRRQRS